MVLYCVGISSVSGKVSLARNKLNKDNISTKTNRFIDLRFWVKM